MKSIDWINPDSPDTGGWKARHLRIVRDRTCHLAHEAVLTCAIQSWCGYAEAHEVRWASPISEDFVLGPAWARWGIALHAMLDGETGALDRATLSTIICDNLREMGFDTATGEPVAGAGGQS